MKLLMCIHTKDFRTVNMKLCACAQKREDTKICI